MLVDMAFGLNYSYQILKKPVSKEYSAISKKRLITWVVNLPKLTHLVSSYSRFVSRNNKESEVT